MLKGLRDSVISKNTLQLLFLAAVVGIISAFIAIGFRYLLFFFQNLFFYQEISGEEVSPVDNTLGLWVIIVPVIGGLLVGLITKYAASEAKGHGVPEVMEAMTLHGGKMRPRIVLFKALASALSIGSGGSVGREGPIIQVGSGIGSTFGQILNLDRDQVRVLVGCGAAGGIAATFNTPVAGIIFALEIILIELKSRSFISLVIAAFFATTVSRIFLGSTPAFEIPAYSFESLYEIVFYLGLGVISGFTSIALIRLVYYTEHLFSKIKIPHITKPAMGGLIVGIIGFFLPQVFGYGYDTIAKLLNQEFILTTILLLLVFKIVAFVVTIGSGASGGIFSPSLFIGAALGASYGWVANYLLPDLTAPAGAYALVGMAAVFAATSRATLTAIIIIFELTLDYKIILPLMFACVIADLVTWLLSKDTIYTKKLAKRGIRISHDMEANKLEVKSIGEMFHRQKGYLNSISVEEMHQNLLRSNVYSACVVNEKDELIGVTTLKDVERKIDSNLAVGEIGKRDIDVGYPDEPLSDALYKMTKNNLEMLPVVTGKNKKLLGYITRSDVLQTFQPEMSPG